MASGRLVAGPLESEPSWPQAGSRRVLLLADASSGIERRLLKAWAGRTRPEPGSDAGGDEWIEIPPSRRRRKRRNIDPRLPLNSLHHSPGTHLKNGSSRGRAKTCLTIGRGHFVQETQEVLAHAGLRAAS